VGLLWIGVQEGRKAVRVLRVATLVLLDRRPLQFPPFLRRHGGGEACSLFEPPPCEPVDAFDISLSFVLFSSFRPLAFYGGEVGLLWIGVREGRKAVRVPGVATLVLLDRRPLQFPPFSEGTGLGKLVLCLKPPLASR